jgi:hypothetical protein
MNLTTGFLTDCQGKRSHTRLLVVVCVPLLVLVPLAIWAFLCLQKGQFLPIDPTVPLYIGTANGVLLGYAGVKSSQESKTPAATP